MVNIPEAGAPCICHCGSEQPCDYDPRFPLRRELAALLGRGVDPKIAVADICRRVNRGQLKQCSHCHRWILSDANNRTLCPDCKTSRRETKEASRGRKRTASKRDAVRKARSRRTAKEQPSAAAVNAGIDTALQQFGTTRQRQAMGDDHLSLMKRSQAKRRSGLTWLRKHKLEDLAAAVLYCLR